MYILPYKFLLLRSRVVVPYAWHKGYLESKPVLGARYGSTIQGDVKTFRLDIPSGYFKSDPAHWTRQNIRKLVVELFPGAKVLALVAGRTIMMFWTSDDFWLQSKEVRQMMRDWNGRTWEPKRVWQEVRQTVKRKGSG